MRSDTLLLALLATSVFSQSTSPSSAQAPLSQSTSASPSIQTITTAVAVPTGDYITYTDQITVNTNGIFTTYLTTTSRLSGSISATATSNETLASTAASTKTTNTLILQGTYRPVIGNNSTLNATASRTTTSAAPVNTQPCNNYVEFCNRRYMNVTEVVAHNAAFTTPNNAARNQDIVILGQLNDGVRMIQGEVQWVNDTLYSCHTNCNILNAGPFVNHLTTVRQWVAVHPYDVVTILIVNSDYRNATDFAPVISAAGLGPYVYIPPKVPMHRNDWPTYSEMILSGKRVVIFMDYQANQTEVPYILDEFSQMWETPFSPTDDSFPCDQQRPPGLNPTQQSLVPYIANHNLNVQLNALGLDILIPNFAEIAEVNAANNSKSSLQTMARSCAKQWGRPPSWLLVDFYQEGNNAGSVFEVAAEMNGVKYERSCCGMTTSVSAAPRIDGTPALILGCLAAVAASALLW